MWQMEECDGFRRSFRQFAKRHRQEARNTLDNVEAYMADLLNGITPQQILYGFVHPEPNGIKALDESGPGAHKKATRLYVYPDEPTETLFLITIGGKDGQQRDIQSCRQFVIKLLKDREEEFKKSAEHGEESSNGET